jgi:uncharacterized membrane protein
MKEAVSYLSKQYRKINDTEQVIILCLLFSMGLLSFRVFYTGSLRFAFLAWNIFLAFLPYLLSLHLSARNNKKSWVFFLLLFLWLILVPNSFYIITDLFHLDLNEDVPLWYDLALLFSFAWTGLLIGLSSVHQVEKLLSNHLNKKLELFLILPLMALNGLGIYIGRYLRFNSWDIITNPFSLMQDLVYLFIHPLRSRLDWSMIICYTLLLTIIYFTIKKLSKAWQ